MRWYTPTTGGRSDIGHMPQRWSTQWLNTAITAPRRSPSATLDLAANWQTQVREGNATK